MNIKSFANPKPVTLRAQIVTDIQEAILEGKLRPGDRIREQDLTKQLNVSRTPIREALIVLEQEGLVISYPNRGCFVPQYGEDDIIEIFEMRTALESLAGELIIKDKKLTPIVEAELQHLIKQQKQTLDQTFDPDRSSVDIIVPNTGQLDRQFHHYLVELAGNTRLLQSWLPIAAQVTAVIYYHIKTCVDYDHYQMISDHQAIVQALCSQDPRQVGDVHHEINARMTQLCIEGLRADCA